MLDQLEHIKLCLIQIKISILVHVWDFGRVKVIVNMLKHLERKIWLLRLNKVYSLYERETRIIFRSW